MNESIIDNEIIEYLSHNPPTRTTQVISKIQEKHPNETGFSNPTFYRKIDRLKKQNLVKEIEPADYTKYGIQSTDKRANYLTLNEVDSRRQYIDEILEHLQNGNAADITSVFHDLNLYTDRYPLNSAQLEKIVPVLKSDLKIVYMALQILYIHMTKHQIGPMNPKELLEQIKQVLIRIGNKDSENLNSEGYCLDILGYWNDSFVIDQLIMDAENFEKIKRVKNHYESRYLSKVIENHRKKLFDVARSLRKENPDVKIMAQNNAIADIILDIRSKATHNILYPPPDADRYSVQISANLN